MRAVHRLSLVMGVLMLCAAAHAGAQAYPTKPIRLIVPSASGGSPDMMARYFSNEASKTLGQTIVVDNRPGAGNLIGFEAVARAPGDGYTIGLGVFSLSANPSLYRKLPYDYARDFQPVAHLYNSVNQIGRAHV
mgnify:CR=1 FL=1